MPVSVYPQPSSAATATLDANTATVGTAWTVLYLSTKEFSVGTYTITCASGSTGYVEFYNGNEFIERVTVVGGTTTTYNLTTAATRVSYLSEFGSASSLPITITKTAAPLTTSTK
jgi:hypothetical protein